MKKTTRFLSTALLLAALTVNAQDKEPFLPNTFRMQAGYTLTGTAKQNFSPWGKDYNSKLMGGMIVELDYARLWKQRSHSDRAFGVGMKYQMVKLKSDEYGLAETTDRVKDRPITHYIAPQFARSYQIAPKLYNTINIGVGYMYYYNDGKKNGKSCVTKGSGFGINWGLDLEYRMLPSVGFAVDVNYTYSGFGKLHQTYEGQKTTVELNSDYEFRPSHLDFMFSIRYHW